MIILDKSDRVLTLKLLKGLDMNYRLSDYFEKDKELSFYREEEFIGKGVFFRESAGEAVFMHQIPLEELSEGMSIRCLMQRTGKEIRFHGKLKNFSIQKITLFMIGEPIVNNERNYLRIEDKLEIFSQKIEFNELEIYQEKIFQQVSAPDIEYLIPRNDPYYKIFKTLTEQLNKIQDMMIYLVNQTERNENNHFEQKKANISASGIRFPNRNEYKKGELIYIRIKLSFFDEVQIIGEVIDSKKMEEEDSFETAIEYRWIDFQAKERLIYYIFQRERVLRTASKLN